MDSEHLNSNLFARYQGSATNVNFSYNYVEGQSAQSSLIGQVISSEDEALIETESNYVNLAATYQYSPKLSFSTGVLLNKLIMLPTSESMPPKKKPDDSFEFKLSVFRKAEYNLWCRIRKRGGRKVSSRWNKWT